MFHDTGIKKINTNTRKLRKYIKKTIATIAPGWYSQQSSIIAEKTKNCTRVLTFISFDLKAQIDFVYIVPANNFLRFFVYI